jgi:hypothetical protein
VPLARDRKDLMHDWQVGQISRGNVVIEGPECREPCMSPSDRVAAVLFEMVEEPKRDRCVREGQRRQRTVGLILDEPEQQPECIAVAGDRAGGRDSIAGDTSRFSHRRSENGRVVSWDRQVKPSGGPPAS